MLVGAILVWVNVRVTFEYRGQGESHSDERIPNHSRWYAVYEAGWPKLYFMKTILTSEAVSMKNAPSESTHFLRDPERLDLNDVLALEGDGTFQHYELMLNIDFGVVLLLFTGMLCESWVRWRQRRGIAVGVQQELPQITGECG